MKKIIFSCFLAVASVCNIQAQSVYDFSATDDAGQMVSLGDYKGKVLLIVNTATRCGFTPQYNDLQALFERYQDQGFFVLDFPCNQFGQQAPGSIAEIHEFCTANFDITFPQFDKVDVNGAGQSPLFAWLKEQKGFGGFNLNTELGQLLDRMMRQKDATYDKNADIKWNFTKFLLDRNGKVVKRFEPTDDMEEVRRSIEQLLKVND